MAKDWSDAPVLRVSRRRFLEGTTALSATALLGSSVLARGALAAVSGPSELINGSHWGAFKAVVEGGRFVKALPIKEDKFPSAQLEGVVDSVYSASRIKYPMVRAGYLKNGPKGGAGGRGSDEYVRVSWDKAIELVAGEVDRVRKDHGNTSIFAGSYGWKSSGKLHNCRNLVRRMLNTFGGHVSHIGDYSTAASQVIMPHVMGTLEVYEQQTTWPVVVENSDMIVWWGANPSITNQIDWIMCEHGGYEGMAEWKKTGKPTLCIDPIKTATVRYFDAEWVAPKPHTDVAMMLGMMHTLYTENLYDKEFIEEYTVGFDKFLPYLTGDSDGTPKTPEWAESISGVPAATMKDLARRFAKNRVMLMSGWSLQRSDNGEQKHWMLVTLASMLGQIGLPGGGFGLSYHYSNGGTPTCNSPVLPGITATGKAVKGMPWMQNAGLSAIPVARVVDMLENPGKVIDFNGRKITYEDIKMVSWVGGNPFSHHQDRNRMVAAWQKPETIVVHDMFWTATARHADIVLPATTSYERNDIEQGGSYSLRLMIGMHKVIDPLFEAKSDFEIFRLISAKLGNEKGFTDGKDEMAWIKSFYGEALKQAKAKKIPMPEFDDFWNGRSVLEFKPTEEAKNFVRYADYREDPLLEPLGTPSGKIEIYSKTIEGFGYDDCPPHATWMEPFDWLGAKAAKKFPLHVVTAHPKYRLHSQLAGSNLREKFYAVKGREPMLINPKDAAARGIKDGDIVRVHNDRGQLLAGAVITDDVIEGVVRICEGGWYDPVEGGKPGSLDAYGDVNVLSRDKGTSKLAQGNCGHTIIAQAEKFTGTVPPVKVFDAPKGA